MGRSEGVPGPIREVRWLPRGELINSSEEVTALWKEVQFVEMSKRLLGSSRGGLDGCRYPLLYLGPSQLSAVYTVRLTGRLRDTPN